MILSLLNVKVKKFMQIKLHLTLEKKIPSVYLSYLATIIAERAAAALKESRRQRRQQDIGIPTWTGRSGAVGAPKLSKNTSPKFGSGNVSGFKNRDAAAARPSSSSLLAKMRARRAMEANETSAGSGKISMRFILDKFYIHEIE